MKNKFSKEIEKSGWSTIADPNSAIDIYDLLYDKRKTIVKIFDSLSRNCKPLKYIGKINTMFKNDYTALSTKPQIGYATNNTVDNSHSLKADLSYLHKLVKKMGASLKGGLHFDKVNNINFTFSQPERHFQTINSISQYVKLGKAVQNHNNYNDLFDENIYIVYEIKKTKSFTAEFFDKTGAGIEFSLEMLKGLVKGNVKTSLENEKKTKITFEGEQDFIIAFKAAKIQNLGKAYSIFESKYKDLENQGFNKTEMRLLYPLVNNLYQTEEEFKAALPESFDAVKKDILLKHFKFENFKLDPTDNIRYLDGEHNIENLQTEVPFVSIEI
ncbi:MAG: hypothetical protein U9Q83_02600 [Bacteroidota bacterium]|nr:hypothetical protein [Bacteroidota bacterium]